MLALSLSVPDIHVVSLLPTLEGLIVPSKIYGILAAARPTLFLGSPEGAVARILEAKDAGITLDCRRCETFVPVILSLMGDPGRLATMGRNARQAFERKYSAKRTLDAWRNVLNQPRATGPDNRQGAR